ncbi:hypothetical protein MKX03_021967 [Papaver bracteatum]|nr:hypothetical protein MKX03_021967 [Papaver bracteatum]
MYSSCARMAEARRLFEKISDRTAGDVDSARLMFDEAPFKDRGIWGCMISSFVQNKCFKKGLEMFPIFVSLLSACAHLGSVDIGIWIHKHLKRMQLPMTVQLNTAVIDMYAKCGNLDVICWNVGLTMNGDAENALALFVQMEKDGFRPKYITFIAVLTA